MALLRMLQEEALVAETFGEEFEAYRGRTQRLLPCPVDTSAGRAA